jgi:nucleotide-binding universal stress UspA family protein
MYRHILVVLDSSGQSERSLTRVLLMARKVNCTVHLLTVYPLGSVTASVPRHDGCLKPCKAQAMQYLRRLATRLRKQGLLVSMQVRFGQPVETILTIAREQKADLIAMTIPWRAGNCWPEDRHITEEVIKQAPIPVLVERSCLHLHRRR